MLRAESPPHREEIENALARSFVYRFLSRAVSYPTEGQQEEIRSHLRPRLDGLKTEAEEFDRSLSAALQASLLPLERLRQAHVAVLGHTVSPDCPDYETAYSATDIFMQTQAMADVAGFYVAHGLKVGGTHRERPDHIATELEFMSFLALKEAYALEHLGDGELEICRETERTFLRDHLGRWGSAFGERIVLLAGTDSPYEPIGRLLAAWIEDECERHATGPRTLLNEPTLPPQEQEEAPCGLEPAPAFIGLDDIQEVQKR